MMILSAVAALAAGCHSDPNVRKMKYMASGDRYSAEGKYREATIQYSNALNADKGFADAHYALAKAYVHLGVYVGASRELSRTVELQPNNYQARIDLGTILLTAGKADAAAQQADAALKLQPDNPDLHALLSAIALNRGDKATALTEIQRAIELAPNRSSFYENLAILQMRNASQGSAAEADLKKAIALDPQSAQPQLLLSAYYIENGRLAEGEQVARNAVSTDPHSVAARTNLAKVLLREGDQAKAEQVLRQASQDLSADPKGERLLADYYAQSGQTDKAATEFSSLAETNPKNLQLQKDYLRALLQEKNYASGQKVADRLMKQNPKDPEIAALNGIELLSSGKSNQALSALQDGARNFPQDAFIQYWLGSAALSTGDTGLAEKSFQRVITLRPEAIDALDQLAQMAMRRGDLGELLDVANKTIAAAPKFAGGYVWRATAEAHQNAPEKAEADLNTALQLAPASPRAYLEFGKLRFSQKRFPEGETLLEKSLQLNPNEVEAMRLLVAYDIYRKQPDKAMTLLNSAAEKSPKNSAILDLLAHLQISLGQVKEAAAIAQKAIQVNPEDAEAVMLVAQTAVRLGNTSDAVQAWRQWLNAHPNDANATAILGTLEEATGNTQLAESEYKKSLQIQPQQPLAANNLAYLMLQNGGDVNVALSLAQTARQKLPNSPDTADTLAWAYYHKGTYGFARELLEDALQSDPKNAAMEYHLGMVYSKLNDKDHALVHLKKAVSLGQGTSTAVQAGDALHNLG